jgi:hypothetical protein
MFTFHRDGTRKGVDKDTVAQLLPIAMGARLVLLLLHLIHFTKAYYI